LKLIDFIHLQTAYNERDSVYTFLRKVFALPFLPAEHTPPAFEKLKEKSTDEKTQEIMQY
jgi:hypothetical protein